MAVFDDVLAPRVHDPEVWCFLSLPLMDLASDTLWHAHEARLRQEVLALYQEVRLSRDRAAAASSPTPGTYLPSGTET